MGGTTYGDVSSKLAQYAAKAMLSDVSVSAIFEPKVRPGDVACRYCGAEAGRTCTKTRRGKWGTIKVTRLEYHPDRRYDAKIATQALRALTSSNI